MPLPRSDGGRNNPKSSHLYTLRAEVAEEGREEDRIVCAPATMAVKFTRTRGTQTNSRLKRERVLQSLLSGPEVKHTPRMSVCRVLIGLHPSFS